MIDTKDMMRTFGALNQEVLGSHTPEEFYDLLRLWKWRCFYCARPICKNSLNPDTEATEDHMDPISRGGTDFIWNIVPACFACNRLKGALTVDEFRAARPVFSGKISEIYTEETGLPPNGKPGAPPTNPQPCKTDLAKTLQDAVAHLNRTRAMDLERHPEYWQNRRTALRNQAASIGRRRLEGAGQLTLPIFGDGTEKLPALSEAAALTVAKGLHVTERKA